jgi:hypothetical protein
MTRRRFSPSVTIVRGIVAAVLGVGLSVIATLAIAHGRTVRTTAQLNHAATQLEALTDGAPSDDPRRAAIAWGYAERLRLGLESPFRLVEAASRDERLSAEERRTIAWALLAHITRGEAGQPDATALDGISGRGDAGASGAQHLRLIHSVIVPARNPRAAELALRMAYLLAATEHVVEPSAPVLAAEAAALVSDAEIARREAVELIRSAGNHDPIERVRERRAHHAFYVERPTLLSPAADLQRAAIALVPALLDSLRAMRATPMVDSVGPALGRGLAPRLFATGAQALPAAPLAVTVRRYLPAMRADAPSLDLDALSRVRNTEMLLAATRTDDRNVRQRRAIARLLLASGAAMRSMAQDAVWTPADSAKLPADPASAAGVAAITFDRDVPASWRPYFVRALLDGMADMRRVFPDLRLDGLTVRFRFSAPADSALAMHDPRTRTLHLPVVTAGGTLSHELAHDLDRQNAQQRGLSGYRSDLAMQGRAGSVRTRDGRLAASLRALTEELAPAPAINVTKDRPAEIFATRVDWFVASSLAREGRSDGFLSAVEDELLTGHVVHPERLRYASRAGSLVDALSAMTTVAPFASSDAEPTTQELLRWALTTPVDRRLANDVATDGPGAWQLSVLASPRCSRSMNADAQLIRLAAESRARGWLRARARWMPENARPAWARAALGQAPWSRAMVDARVDQVRDVVLIQLGASDLWPAGLAAYAAPLARAARCAQ